MSMTIASGRTIAASAVMLIIATFQILEGIRAVMVGGTFVDPSGFQFNANNTAFGWLHIAIGAVVAVAALALISGRIWARALAVAIAVLSAVATFFYIPFIPVFALVVIALDIFVIWAATTTPGPRMMREMDEQAGMGAGHGGGGGNAQTGGRWPTENAPSGRDWEADNRQTQREQAAAQERANAEARGGQPRDYPPGGNG